MNVTKKTAKLHQLYRATTTFYERNMWRDIELDGVEAAKFDTLHNLKQDLKTYQDPDELLTVPFGYSLVLRQDDIGLLIKREDQSLHVHRIAVWGELPDVSLEQCEFYLIYTIDCEEDYPLRRFYPRHVYRKWNITEKEGGIHTDYRFDKYRKLVAQISYADFMHLAGKVGLSYECETMGSITERGCLPALSFSDNGRESGVMLNAYVTPLPMWDPPDSEREQTLIWEKLSQLLKEI